MIGLDTNVLVRYLTQDDPDQAERASILIENNCTKEAPGRITLVVLCELVWVLRGAYGYPKNLIVEVLELILATKELIVEKENTARSALKTYRKGGADFADYVIIFANRVAGCKKTFSFDRKMIGNEFVRMP